MDGANNLNFNDLDFDLSFNTDYTQPAAQMTDQAFMKPNEDNTSSFFFAGDEGIDTSGGQFGVANTQQSFGSMNATDLFSFPHETGFGLQQNLSMDNTMASASAWNNQLSPAIDDFASTSTPVQSFGSLNQSQFSGSGNIHKRPLQLDTQDFPQPKRQERSGYADFSPFVPSASVTGSSWTVDTQPTPTSLNEIGLSDEAADVCATWFSKYGVLPGDRHIESLSQLTEESPTAIRHWFGQMLKQGMSGHDSAYKSQTRLSQQDQLTNTSTGWMDTASTAPCSNDTTTTTGQSAPRGGRKGCTPTDKHELLCRDPNKIYQCTRKCGKRYGRKCDWKRNEEEGYPSKSWQCSLCVSQGVEKVKPCFRRYHFSQHFRNIHPGLNSADYEEESVVHSDTSFPRKCGFCPHRFTSRQDRIDHIADHFKKGKNMLLWNDDEDDSNDSDNVDDDDDRHDSDAFDNNNNNSNHSNNPQDKDSQDRPGPKQNGSGNGGNQRGGRRQPPPSFSQFHLSEISDEVSHGQSSCGETANQHIKPHCSQTYSGTQGHIFSDGCAEGRSPPGAYTGERIHRNPKSTSSSFSSPSGSIPRRDEAADCHTDAMARDAVTRTVSKAMSPLPKITKPELGGLLQDLDDQTTQERPSTTNDTHWAYSKPEGSNSVSVSPNVTQPLEDVSSVSDSSSLGSSDMDLSSPADGIRPAERVGAVVEDESSSNASSSNDGHSFESTMPPPRVPRQSPESTDEKFKVTPTFCDLIQGYCGDMAPWTEDLHHDLQPDEPGLPASSLSSTFGCMQPFREPFNEESKEKGICPNPECGRVFKHLKTHMLAHQNERPEKCPIATCEYHFKGFARKYDENRHTLTHYKGTMVCGFCSATALTENSFTRTDVFKRHLTRVHDVKQNPTGSRKKSRSEKPGNCSICTVKFANAQEFYEHLDDCVTRVVLKDNLEMHTQQIKESAVVIGTGQSLQNPEDFFNALMSRTDTHKDVSYIETHGNGTPAGSGIGITSVTDVFAPRRSRHRFHQTHHLGATKAKIGHSSATEGISSLLEVIMMMNARTANVTSKHVTDENDLEKAQEGVLLDHYSATLLQDSSLSDGSEMDVMQDPLLETTCQATEHFGYASDQTSSGKSDWHEINPPTLDMYHTSQSFLSVKLLGTGGFSTVDEVVHRETNLRVSRKTLKNREHSALEELKKEVDVLQKLRHPHIIRFLGAYSKGDKVSILLSPVAETTLALWIDKSMTEKPAGLTEVILKMYGCLASTIRYLHEQRPVIKHMDIKPQNILVMHGDSGIPHIVLSDFGISSSEEDSSGPRSKPLTRQYCAPEVPETATRGQAADIWSLGCVFLEMASAILIQSNPKWQEFRQEFHGSDGKCYWQDVSRLHEYLSEFLDHATAPQETAALHTIKAMLSREPAERPNAARLTIIFTPSACCLKWPNEKVSFPGPLEELGTVEMLDCLAELQSCTGADHRHELGPFERAKSWLDECSHGHEACRRQTSDSKSLPTRLVDSQPRGPDGRTIRVVNSSEIEWESSRVEYVVLNHLWSQWDVTLSNDRLGSSQGEISREILPKAVNDAISAANRIGFRYIWADSLCVLQDSEEEKRRECAAMASVYRNAALTIVVDKVNQENAENDRSDSVNPVLRAALTLSDDIANTSLPLIDWYAPGFAWDTRAWSLQERLLSHRLLHLAGEQMYWECNSLKASETFPRGLPPLIWEKVHTKTTEAVPGLRRGCQLTKDGSTDKMKIKIHGLRGDAVSVKKEESVCFESVDLMPDVKSKIHENEDAKFDITKFEIDGNGKQDFKNGFKFDFDFRFSSSKSLVDVTSPYSIHENKTKEQKKFEKEKDIFGDVKAVKVEDVDIIEDVDGDVDMDMDMAYTDAEPTSGLIRDPGNGHPATSPSSGASAAYT